MNPSCTVCRYSFMKPRDPDRICGHKDAGLVGTYTVYARLPSGHCGEAGRKFEQHPLRDANGALKSVVAHVNAVASPTSDPTFTHKD